MASWFRSWHGAPTDNKWLVIARRAGASPGVVSATFWALLDYASQADDRGSVAGFDIETYAEFSGFTPGTIDAVLCAMAEKNVIVDGRLTAWDKRQPKREDDSYERVKRHRESVTQCNAEKRTVTQSNNTEQIRTDTETEKTPPTPSQAQSQSVVGVLAQAQPEQPQADKERGAIIELWEQLAPGSLSPLLAEKIHDMIDSYGADEVVRAIGIARDNNKRSPGYVEGILRRRANGEGAPGTNGNGAGKTYKQQADEQEKLRADAKRAQAGIRTSERLGFTPQAHDLAVVEKARKAGAI
jgi:DnaD/phage-associated family protein